MTQRNMKIHKYDDNYAEKNGVNGVKEIISMVVVGVIGLIAPVILLAIDIIPAWLMLAIIVVVAATIFVLRYRYMISMRASISALIESDEELYYMQINPDLRGVNIPRSISTALAGQNAAFAENSLEAAEVASSMAQSDEIITYLFELYKDKKIETTFDTLMYGKPIHIRKIIDKDFNKEYKRIYKVDCILDGKKSTVKIPNAFPTFFPKD